MAKYKNLKEYGKILLVILLFTAIDYFFHLIPYLSVNQPEYSLNKALYGSILAVVGYLIVKYIKRLGSYAKASIFTLIVIIPLQVRYLYYHNGLIWNLVVLALHYAILTPTSYYLLFRREKY